MLTENNWILVELNLIDLNIIFFSPELITSYKTPNWEISFAESYTVVLSTNIAEITPEKVRNDSLISLKQHQKPRIENCIL